MVEKEGNFHRQIHNNQSRYMLHATCAFKLSISIKLCKGPLKVQPRCEAYILFALIAMSHGQHFNLECIVFVDLTTLGSLSLFIIKNESVFYCRMRKTSLLRRWNFGMPVMRRLKPFSLTGFVDSRTRRTLICAVNQDAEEAFKKTVEVDKLIDKLRDANPNEEAFKKTVEVDKLIDKLRDANPNEKDYEELAVSVMSIVDRLVHKTNEKIESSTDVLKDILKPVVDEVEEISWPPRDPDALNQMEKEIIQREKEGQLDEGFLAEVNAQLRQAKEDGDKPGLEAMLQKVLQLYASIVLSKRSYAKKVEHAKNNALTIPLVGDEVLKAEQFLETIIKAPEEQWNKLLIDGITLGKGEVSPEELYAVIKKRIERTLIRTEGGSYKQRILTEYLKGIQSRAEELVQLLQGNPQ
ncbi:hypothetical protein L484_008432 [Morus notabilis]|uniref:Uncharacterized protein n=1 Tax=Morus notabilis TaxID=981085 RepID=W9S383_9ROSA|nr:hypothetical protein L484_008432 [Morus notabilis]